MLLKRLNSSEYVIYPHHEHKINNEGITKLQDEAQELSLLFQKLRIS